MDTQTREFGFWDKMFSGELEHNRFGIISIVLLLVGCIGGLTVGFGAMNHTWQLMTIVIPTMITLSLLLAVAPLKQLLTMASITVIINFIIMLINFV